MKVFLIPGLGYDCRIFDRLDLQEFDVTKLEWIEPKKDEKIHNYSQRLFANFKNSKENILLIGHSLGGIVSQEIASTNQITKIILISSIKSRKELPLYFKLVKPLRLYKFFTREISLSTFRYWGKSHGFQTENEKGLFRSMVGKQTNTYLKWALRELSSWHEPEISSDTQIIQIHGTKDKTFPFKLINSPNFSVEGGSHICVLRKAEKISAIIKSIIH